MRICIVADNASYRFGGEAVLPLHYFSRLRQRNIEAWLVAHARTREELEAIFANDKDRLRFVEDAWVHRMLFRMSRFVPRRLAESTLGLWSYLVTQYFQVRIVRDLIRQEAIDILHQPVPVSPRFPSLMAKLGIPVIQGPMNGGMEYPPAFRHTESLLSRLSVRIGRYFSSFINSILSGKKLARVLLVANQRTRQALPACVQGRIIEMHENGVDLTTWAPRDKAKDASLGNVRFVFMGRLVDWKSVDIIIEALNHVDGAELEIIGSGPMRYEWQQMADRLGLSERVFFSGWLSQQESAVRLQSALALLLPSVYECGGAVVLEAMATGIPVIATRWGGPTDYLDSSCGILIEPSSRNALVQGFAAAMRRLMVQPELARQLGARGRTRVQQDFDWERKIDQMIEIYQSAIGPDIVAAHALSLAK